MTLHSEMIQGITKQRRLCWDEENRLLLSADEEQLAGYVYDAAGMRTHKASGTTTVSTVNGQPSYFGNISSMTLYPSELITVSTGMYTKHYYNGSQRLASRIGGGFAPHPDLNHYDPLTDQVELPNSGDYHHKAQALVDLWTRQAECAGLQPSLEFSYSLAEGNLHNPLSEHADGERYFYHSDHLGSSAFITTENGYATQFLAYLPFGETLNEEQNSSNYYSPFKFSAKEKDPETGYSYFGARYYSPELSIWLSVDPMADERPWLSPYNYCQWNPIMLVDPTGLLDEDTKSLNGIAGLINENRMFEQGLSIDKPVVNQSLGRNALLNKAENGGDGDPTPTPENGGFIKSKVDFLDFMKDQAKSNPVEVAAWELVNPEGGENIYFVQPWAGNEVDMSENDHAPGFNQRASYVRQIHTHPGSNPPGFTDASISSTWGIPVVTIGANGIIWEVSYPSLYAVPRGLPYYGNQIMNF